MARALSVSAYIVSNLLRHECATALLLDQFARCHRSQQLETPVTHERPGWLQVHQGDAPKPAVQAVLARLTDAELTIATTIVAAEVAIAEVLRGVGID